MYGMSESSQYLQTLPLHQVRRVDYILVLIHSSYTQYVNLLKIQSQIIFLPLCLILLLKLSLSLTYVSHWGQTLLAPAIWLQTSVSLSAVGSSPFSSPTSSFKQSIKVNAAPSLSDVAASEC